MEKTNQREATGRHAFLVAAGILASRIAGLVRQRVFGYYFGLSDAADAFNAAFRIPNFLQNLFGEGVLSASFIPVYARLLAEGDEEESGRVAGAVASRRTRKPPGTEICQIAHAENAKDSELSTNAQW